MANNVSRYVILVLFVSKRKCTHYGYCRMVLLDHGEQHKVTLSTDNIYAYALVAAPIGKLVNQLRAELLRSD